MPEVRVDGMHGQRHACRNMTPVHMAEWLFPCFVTSNPSYFRSGVKTQHLCSSISQAFEPKFTYPVKNVFSRTDTSSQMGLPASPTKTKVTSVTQHIFLVAQQNEVFTWGVLFILEFQCCERVASSLRCFHWDELL